MRKTALSFVALALGLSLPAPCSAQSAGAVILTGWATSKTVVGTETVYTFADGWAWSFDSGQPYNPGHFEFKDANGNLLGDPARGPLASQWGVREQGGVFFVEAAFRPPAATPTAALGVTPYNFANAPGGRLVYRLISYGPGQHDAESEGVNQDW